jgi:cytochrome oxidase Cu insertion factor (SCO1/SenC/PrrC family)
LVELSGYPIFDKWHFVTGPLSALKRVWSSYGVGADAHSSRPEGHSARLAVKPDDEPSQGLSTLAVKQARTIAGQFGGGYEVSHSSPIWIIDKDGLIRALMDADALPTEIAGNVRALMGR